MLKSYNLRNIYKKNVIEIKGFVEKVLIEIFYNKLFCKAYVALGNQR